MRSRRLFGWDEVGFLDGRGGEENGGEGGGLG